LAAAAAAAAERPTCRPAERLIGRRAPPIWPPHLSSKLNEIFHQWPSLAPLN